MIKVKIDDKEYKVPNSFDELSIGLYQEINLIDDKDEKEKIINYLNILTGIDRKIILRIEIATLKDLFNRFDFFENDFKDTVVDAVEIENKVYVFDDNLTNMRFDMFIDLEEMTKNKDDVVENLHLIMAMLYRPAQKKKVKGKLKPKPYNTESVIERAEFFKEYMMMDKILGALFFFTNLNLQYIQDLEVYLKRQIQEKREKEMINL